MLYKANFMNDTLNVSKVIGYTEEDGTLVLLECGYYSRHLGYDGVMYGGSAYGSTREAAIAGLENYMRADLIVAKNQVARLERLLASIPSGDGEKASA